MQTAVAISKTTFSGYRAVTIETRAARMVIVTEIGPRIAFFGPRSGVNLLFWDKAKLGRGEWRVYGGHRLWTTRPMADESEEAYAADNAPCRARLGKDRVTVEAPASAGLRRGLRIRALDARRF